MLQRRKKGGSEVPIPGPTSQRLPVTGSQRHTTWKDAVKYMDGEKIDGQKINVSRADNRPPIRHQSPPLIRMPPCTARLLRKSRGTAPCH